MPSTDELKKVLMEMERAIDKIDTTIGKRAARAAGRNFARKAAEWGYQEGSAIGGGDYYQWKKELDAILGDRHE